MLMHARAIWSFFLQFPHSASLKQDVFSFTPIKCLVAVGRRLSGLLLLYSVWPGIVYTGVDDLFTNVLASRLVDSMVCASSNACLNSNFDSASNLCFLDSTDEPVAQHTFEIIELIMFCNAPQLTNILTNSFSRLVTSQVKLEMLNCCRQLWIMVSLH